MKKLDRFILKAFIGPFVAILLVVIFILMMQFLSTSSWARASASE